MEETLEPWLGDIRRRTLLGLENAARHLASAVIGALAELGASPHDDWLLLAWAPDFLDEATSSVESLLADLDDAATTSG